MNEKHLSEEQLWMIVDGDESEHNQVHLRNCSACQSKLMELTQIHNELKGIQSFGPSPWFAASIIRKRRESTIRHPWFVAVAGVTFIVALIISFLIALPHIGHAASPSTIQLLGFVLVILIFRIADHVLFRKTAK